MTGYEYWTDENKADLMKMVADGMSATKIAQIITRSGYEITRNGVLGQIYRIRRKTGAPPPPKKAKAEKPDKAPRAKAPDVQPPAKKRGDLSLVKPLQTDLHSKPLPRSTVIETGVEPVAFIDLPFRGRCKWCVKDPPAGEGMERMMCCAAPTLRMDDVYCDAHRRIALTSAGLANAEANRASSAPRKPPERRFG